MSKTEAALILIAAHTSGGVGAAHWKAYTLAKEIVREAMAEAAAKLMEQSTNG